MPIVAKQRVHFGPFELDAHAGELYKHGLKLKLQGHPIQILAMLLERPGELITREEIQQKLWPSESETFVDFEHGLNTAVRKLRKALGDEAETPQYIETLPRRGYRFVGQIAAEDLAQPTSVESPVAVADATQTAAMPNPAEAVSVADSASASASLEQAAQRKRLSYRPLLVLLLLPALLAIATYLYRSVRGGPNHLVVTGTKQLTLNDKVGYGTTTFENYASIQTDGRRIYYTVIAPNPLRYISAKGGEETVLPSAFSDPAILHISPDGSTLLVRESMSAKGTNEDAIWLVAASGGAARRLGDIEAQDAAFAPDGETIVFAKGSGLYLTDTKGLNPLELAEVPGHAFWLRWSPDGQRLRFSVLDPDTARVTLWELSADRKRHQLLKDWKYAGQVCCGVWTGDGKHFLFSASGQYWYLGESSFWERPIPEQLTTSGLVITAAATNPLAKELFVSAALPTSDVFAWDPGSNRLSVLYPELNLARLQFSADGQQIAYTRPASPGRELWVALVDGSNKRLIAASPTYVSMARFSPDGQNIAFMAHQPAGPWKVYWVSAQGGAWHEIPDPGVSQADPNWSPDGQSILFGQVPETFGEPGRLRHLYSYDLRTGKTTEIPGSAGLFSPRWSPDGRYVAAMSIDFRSMSLLDVTSGEWSSLVVHFVDNPFWSPDSAWVYFREGETGSLWRVRATDRRLERVLGASPIHNNPGCWANGFAPDGSILWSCIDERRNIFALDLK